MSPAMFSLASKLLSTIDSPAFQNAYGKSCSRDELHKLMGIIQKIQSVLLDAEKKQENSVDVRKWIKDVSDVFYDADDLFDEVVTDYMLKQPIIKEGKLLKKVLASFPKLYRNSIANQFKAIMERLREISTDMGQFASVDCVHEEPISGARKGLDPGSFVDSEEVIGRDEEKEAILKFLLQDQSNDGVSVTAIVGIEGMGKTTLAQLVYNDWEVKKNFEKRWFANISGTLDHNQVIEKIFQSICHKKFAHFDHYDLEYEMRMLLSGRKFLLVLDDWMGIYEVEWDNLMSLSRGAAKGSKIIVTARFSEEVGVVCPLAAQTHNLKELSENESWDLFKRVAFTPEQEQDSSWVEIGREIVNKCAKVPLALKIVGSILYTKTTMIEWKLFIDNELSQLNPNILMQQTLELSYYHLPSNLKSCFAYCSLFPSGYIFDMEHLIYLWISQGYVQPINEMLTVEEVGYSYFMELHRRCFFQKSERWNAYTMNDLLHDLAYRVAGKEIIAKTELSHKFDQIPRHVSVSFLHDDQLHTSWGGVADMLNTSQLRSLVFLPWEDAYQCLLSALDRRFTCGKYLRVLSLSYLRIETVSSSITELKHLRYLNLSGNRFRRLPDSLTNLLNLLTLDISGCHSLEELPDHFRKLINLRHLNIWDCGELKHMPPGMEELSSLQKLSDFKVGKATEGVKSSGLDALAGLKLKGELTIYFDHGPHDIDNWDEDTCLQLPVSLEQLHIWNYPGWRIVHSCNTLSSLPFLERLTLNYCRRVKHLSRLRCLPNLKFLALFRLDELEYIEDEEEEEDRYTVTTGYFDKTALFFPLLEDLKMVELKKLNGWSRRKVVATKASSTGRWSPDLSLSFPLLSQLAIGLCGKLTSFPLCPSVRTLKIDDVDGGGLVSVLDKTFPSLEICSISNCRDLEVLHLLGSQFLEELRISGCDRLARVKIKTLPSLVSLEIARCKGLQSLRIASLNVLSEIRMRGCPKELDLWGVNWDSLPNLRRLLYDDRLFPSPNELLNYLGYQEQPGALNLSPRKEIRPASASSPSEITPVLKQEPASIPLTHHPDIDAAGWENRGAAYKGMDKQGSEINESKHTYTGEIIEAEHQKIGASSQEVPYNLSTETDKAEAEECLYILSLLPKDYEFEEDMLIQLWMAGGHIKDETTGNKHFIHLVNKKYLLSSGTNFFTSKGRYHINIKTCQKINQFSEGQNSTLKWENECDTDKCSDGIQHVSLKLQKFSELRTLLFLANDSSLVEEVPAYFFQRFEMDLSGTHLNNLPSSMGHMHHLRYLDLSRTLIEWLPNTICLLKELQTLKLQECLKLRALPEQLSNLTELRHLDVDVLCRLTVMPKGMKALRNLRTLSAFLVGTEDGYKANELGNLNNLTGDFCIAKLENVVSADEAKNAALDRKRNIKSLVLRWTAPEYSWMNNKCDASAVLECLEPCPVLEKLQILCYEGSTFPSWINDPKFKKLVHVSFYKCEKVLKLPPLEQLPSLKDLELVEMNSVEAFEVQGRSGMVAFPCLKKLTIDEMQSLRTLRLVKKNDDDFRSLAEITIRECPKLESVPNSDFPKSLDILIVDDCYVIGKNSTTSEDEDEDEYELGDEDEGEDEEEDEYESESED